jgi:Transglycosylase-like domain
MIMMRRVLLLAFISISGIALLSPLSARSAAQLPDTARDHLLALQPAPRADAPRGGILTGRGSTVQAAAMTNGAEALVPQPDDAPATVTMEATLVFIAATPPPAPAQPVATYSGNGVWDDLARCESSGNWAINTGNGYYGGLQFSLGTWNGYGGAEFAEYPHQATRAEQITVAERLRDARGYQPWPACRAKLGLP